MSPSSSLVTTLPSGSLWIRTGLSSGLGWVQPWLSRTTIQICTRLGKVAIIFVWFVQAVALCQFLENNQQQVNFMDKAVLEIGAGTGLLSIVASLQGECLSVSFSLCRPVALLINILLPCALSLGAWVTATDLPDILSNLTFNLSRNTKGRCRYTPQVAALTWGQNLERDFPCTSCHYDYVLAADVVYHHDYLEELLVTMRHFCRPGSGTTLLWANKVRFPSDLRFTESFKNCFNTVLLAEMPQQEVRIYRATTKEWMREDKRDWRSDGFKRHQGGWIEMCMRGTGRGCVDMFKKGNSDGFV